MSELNVYTNYGDRNPVEHGGLWIKKDTEIANCYYVVTVNKNDDVNNQWFLGDCYIDLTDSWIDWSSVTDCCDLAGAASDEEKVIGVLTYYGVENCNGTLTPLDGRENVVAELKNYDISC